VDAHRVNARMVSPATEPFLASGVIPQRAIQLPGIHLLVLSKKAARERAAPSDAVLIVSARRKRPDKFQGPLCWRPLGRRVPWLVVGRFLRILRRGDLLPAGAAVPRARNFDAEGSVVEIWK